MSYSYINDNGGGNEMYDALDMGGAATGHPVIDTIMTALCAGVFVYMWMKSKEK